MFNKATYLVNVSALLTSDRLQHAGTLVTTQTAQTELVSSTRTRTLTKLPKLLQSRHFKP